jgi:hypothetical protein
LLTHCVQSGLCAWLTLSSLAKDPHFFKNAPRNSCNRLRICDTSIIIPSEKSCGFSTPWVYQNT